jgi:Fe-S cluster assembly ATP-binding protein
MLKLENIWLKIANDNGENKEILRGINLEFEKGKIYAVTGPNGGGKTSIAKVIMGIYKQTEGKIILEGEDISGLSVTERARKGISYAFQQPPRFKGLTVKDLMNIAKPGLDNFQLRAYLRDVGLCPEDYMDRPLGADLSGGEIKRIEIAQLLAKNSVISIFDEPEAGVDLWTIQKMIGIILQRYRDNPDRTAVIITHNENVLPICDEIIVIDEGQIREQGTTDAVWHLIKDEIQCKMREQCRGEMINEF